MENNAIINTRLAELFDFMDPRASVTIFEDTTNEFLTSNKLFNLIADKDFIGNYGKYKVFGLSTCLNTISILIKEA